MSRRGRGEGSVYWNERRGRWEACVSRGTSGGRRVRKTFTGATKGEALEGLRTWQRERGDLLPPDADRITVGDVLTAWGAEYKGTVQPESWAHSYEPALRLHLVPRLGLLRLAALNTTTVAAGLADLTPPQRLLRFRLMKAACRWAVARGWLIRNPLEELRRPKVVRRRGVALAPGQVRTFLAHAEGDRMAPLWTVLALTGCRLSEGLGRLELVGDVLTIHEQRGRGGRFKGLKTENSYRSFRVGPEVVAAAPFVRPWSQRTAGDRFAKLVRRAGLPAIHVHDLRHSYITNQLRAGVPVHVVARRVGNSPEVLLRTYAHVLADMDARAVGADVGQPSGQPDAAGDARRVTRETIAAPSETGDGTGDAVVDGATAKVAAFPSENVA